jgi:hypothetical protein
MRTTTTATVQVAAPRHTVFRFASDLAVLAAWNNEYTECIGRVLNSADDQRATAGFLVIARHGGKSWWWLTVTGPGQSGITEVKAEITEETGLRYPLRWPRVCTGRRRIALLQQSLDRIKGFAESAAHHGHAGLNHGDMVALLNVYTTQFGSFTTLLWQVPALGLTAQAFLMTIVLGAASPSISNGARFAAAGLSIIVAFASIFLMHDQRARAINHAELAKRISYRLSLTDKVLGGSFGLDDAVPRQGTDAQNVWTTNHIIYLGWRVCMALFAFADVFVILSISVPALTSWFT